MKKWRLFWIVTIVILGHIGIFAAIASFRPVPKTKSIPHPTFTAKEKAFTDETTGEHLIAKEFTVSTKLNEDRPK